MRGSVNVPGPYAPRIASGTYTGTGGDQTLEFDFKPQMIFIWGVLHSDSGGLVVLSFVQARASYGQSSVLVESIDVDPELIDASWQNNSLTLSNLSHSQHLLSRADETYTYFVIGE